MAMKPLSPLAIFFVAGSVVAVVVGVVAARNSAERSVATSQAAVVHSLTQQPVRNVVVDEPIKEARADQPTKLAGDAVPTTEDARPMGASGETQPLSIEQELALSISKSRNESGQANKKGELGKKDAAKKDAAEASRKDPRNPDVSAARAKKAAPRSSAEQSVYESDADLTVQNPIDELVFAKLKQLKLQPAKLCSDAVFLRRVYLDMTGTLPTEDEVRQFIEDKSPTKRRDLIEHLFNTEDYVVYWAMKWSDVLRIKAEFPINLWPNAAQAYHRWVLAAIRENMPYDRFVRQLLTTSGSNFRVPQVNFYRAQQGRKPEVTAQSAALTFMGTRADKWPKERLAGMTNFFAQIQYKGTAEWKEEIILFEPGKILLQEGGAEKLKAVFPDGTPIELSAEKDPREVFADWLITEKNPWFTTAIVNRIWCWLMGRGIIHEVDDIRDDNPPQNPELLNYLKQELVKSGYDMRHLRRLILNSTTYQLSSIARSEPELSAANFGHYAIRRLDGEVIIDAICQITGTTEYYESAIPEPFSWIPDFYRTIALPDGSITSAFLEMFGRPPRDTGLEVERTNRLSAAQRLHLLNSTHIRKKLETGPKLQALIRSLNPSASKQSKGGRGGKPSSSGTPFTGNSQVLAERLYLTILSRFPTPQEQQLVRGQSPTDIAWALINSVEFLHRH